MPKSHSRSASPRGGRRRYGRSPSPEKRRVKLKKVDITKLYKSPFRETGDFAISSLACGAALTKELKKHFGNLEDVDKLRRTSYKRKLGDIHRIVLKKD